MLLVDLLRPNMIVELGTYYGDSYCAFCQAVRELNLDTRCYAIDTWQGDPHSGLYGPEALKELRAHHDPLYASFSRLVQASFDEALQHFADGTIDLLHIDGYHTYEQVKHDFESWFAKMSPHGVILLHDINVLEGDFGVRKFWDEIKPRFPHFEFLHCHGLGILAVGKVRSKELRALLNATSEDAIRIRNFFFELGHRLTSRVKSQAENARLVEELEQTRKELSELDVDRGRVLGQLEQTKKKLEDVQAAVQRLDTEKVSLHGQIGSLKTMLEHHQSITSAEISLRDAEVAKLETERSGLIERLDRAEKGLKARDELVNKVHERNLQLDRQISELQSELKGIRASFGYKVMRSYASKIDAVCPEGTRRGEFRKLAVVSLRVLTEKGVQSFIRQALEKDLLVPVDRLKKSDRISSRRKFGSP